MGKEYINSPMDAEELTGVENVLADDSQQQPIPKGAQEAVKMHFNPEGNKPKGVQGQPVADNASWWQPQDQTGVENVAVKDEAGQADSSAQEEAQKEEAPKFGNWQDVLDFLEERRAAIKIPTKEDLERERRRKRTDGIISGLADSASAIANLIFTTKYAPNMYQHENSMSEKMRERYERIQKERDADADRYLNYSMMIGKIKDAQDDREYKRGRDALQDQITSAKAEYNAKLADIKYKVEVRKLSDAEAAAQERDATEELRRQILEARLAEINSRTNKNNRYQPSAGRGSSGGRGSGGGNGGGKAAKYPVYDKDMNLKRYVRTPEEAVTESYKLGCRTYPRKVIREDDGYIKGSTGYEIPEDTKGANTRKLGL